MKFQFINNTHNMFWPHSQLSDMSRFQQHIQLLLIYLSMLSTTKFQLIPPMLLLTLLLILLHILSPMQPHIPQLTLLKFMQRQKFQ